MRHEIRLGQIALAALTAGVLLSGAASSASAVDGEKPARMKLEVTDGKTCPPPSGRTELRFRVPGGALAQSPSIAQSQSEGSISVSLLSYCPANAESRSVVHRACFVGEEPAEAQSLTASMERAAQPMPIRGKLAPPRPRSTTVPAAPYVRYAGAPRESAPSGTSTPPRAEAKRATSLLFAGEANP